MDLVTHRQVWRAPGPPDAAGVLSHSGRTTVRGEVPTHLSVCQHTADRLFCPTRIGLRVYRLDG